MLKCFIYKISISETFISGKNTSYKLPFCFKMHLFSSQLLQLHATLCFACSGVWSRNTQVLCLHDDEDLMNQVIPSKWLSSNVLEQRIILKIKRFFIFELQFISVTSLVENEKSLHFSWYLYKVGQKKNKCRKVIWESKPLLRCWPGFPDAFPHLERAHCYHLSYFCVHFQRNPSQHITRCRTQSDRYS